MPRPKRVRTISCHPKCLKFKSELKDKEVTELTFEEYEAIRLMDYKRLTHDEAASMMSVSRTTVTEIYDQARKKVAKALCEGNDLIISGGNYEIKEKGSLYTNSMKEGKKMIKVIAVTYENGNVFQHFGKSEAFKIYKVEDGKVLSSEVVSTNGQGHGQLAVFLLNHQVHLLICGGIGGGAIQALGQAGIQILAGVNGNTDEAVAAYLNGTLKFDANFECDHHGKDHVCDCGHAHEHRDTGCCCNDKK